jgi:hypothetical protein
MADVRSKSRTIKDKKIKVKVSPCNRPQSPIGGVEV